MNRFATPVVRGCIPTLVALLAAWLLVAGSAGAARAQSHAFGQSLLDWQLAWTSWFLGTTDIPPDANGNADVGHVAFLALPSAPGDGTPASINLTLHPGQPFVLPLFQWIGNEYVDGSVDPFVDTDDFRNMDITLKVDGVPVVTRKNVMDFYTEGAFDPPLTTDLPPGAAAWVFLLSVGIVHSPLSVGKHTITLDESITLPDLGVTTPLVYHNTWNITVKPGR